jgi:hypothetical protein
MSDELSAILHNVHFHSQHTRHSSSAVPSAERANCPRARSVAFWRARPPGWLAHTHLAERLLEQDKLGLSISG